MSATTIKALREALAALQATVADATDTVDSAVTDAETDRDELVWALLTARGQMLDAVTAIRDAAKTITAACEGDTVYVDDVASAVDDLGALADELAGAADAAVEALGGDAPGGAS